ncbi:MAG: 2-hydroxyacid dehydrogenase [Nocardioidaceae bacterium]
MAAGPLTIALGGHDRVLDLFAWITDPDGRDRFGTAIWDGMWTEDAKAALVQQVRAADLPRTTVSYVGDDDVSGCSLLVTETPVEIETVRSTMPTVSHVVQFGRFSPQVVEATAAGPAVVEFERASIRSVAEHAVAMTLCLLRELVQVDRAVRASAPPRAPSEYAYNWLGAMPRSIADARVCILGFGQVGQAVWRALAGLRPAEVTYWSRTANKHLATGAHQPDLMRALTDADVAIVALPLTNDTRDLIGPEHLAALGPAGVLVNVSRGAIVQEDALVSCLQGGALGAAGLDVFAREPMETLHPFRSLDNVLLSPHVAGGTRERLALELLQLLDVVKGLANKRTT